MDRHDADLPLGRVHVALDFGVGAAEPAEEAGKSRRAGVGLEGERQVEELVDRLDRFGAETGRQRPACPNRPH